MTDVNVISGRGVKGREGEDWHKIHVAGGWYKASRERVRSRGEGAWKIIYVVHYVYSPDACCQR